MVVIVNLRNFTFAHNIIVLDDNGHVVENRPSSMQWIVENTLEMCEKYECDKIRLWGYKPISEHVAKDLKNVGKAKFQKDMDITIEID